VAVFLIIVVALGLVFLVAPDQYADERYNQSLSYALLSSLVFLPLQTVLFEELVFRGFFYTYLIDRVSAKRAAVYSSLLFGLWHIGTASGVTIGVLDSLGLGNLTRILTSIGVVLVTAVAGFIFIELRRRSDSLLTPIIAHWAINGTAIILAALSFR
jgi:membrane protease YdiL (CAAX protease family)